MIVRKTSDIIKVKIGGLVAKISPLSSIQKASVQSKLSAASVEQALLGTNLAIKYALKDIDGLTNPDGSKYELSKDENGLLTDEVVDDLMNLEISSDLMVISLTLLNNIPSEFVDPETGKKLKGVEIIKGKSVGKK